MKKIKKNKKTAKEILIVPKERCLLLKKSTAPKKDRPKDLINEAFQRGKKVAFKGSF